MEDQHTLQNQENDESLTVTVEQHLQARCKQMSRDIMSQAKVLTTSLNNQFEAGKEELWAAHESAKATVTSQTNPATTPAIKCNVNITIRGGPHDGLTALLAPRLKKDCFVGRSTGKKFKDKGLSLSKDLEVSTTHGKFELNKDGGVYFTDIGSTNGTFLDEVGVEEGEPLRLPVDGVLEIRVGASVMVCTLESS
ncbi:hypothetical protein ScalyP_jg9246 [Parmales sp. scaly parma]|nr:hypothetical protein ScalyP_jg9246 [Parmales sp. scaly parma]